MTPSRSSGGRREDETRALLGVERGDHAKRNVELGWCPCGENADADCECFGIYRLSCTQGLVPVIARERSYEQ